MDRDGSVIEALRRCLPADRIALSTREVTEASSDQSDLPPVRPVCVVRPRHVDEVQRLVQVAIEFGIPLTPRGAGTGLEGACIPSPGSVVVDFTAMDDVREVVPEERRVTVGPGIVYQHLNRLLSAHGLFFPPSPGGVCGCGDDRRHGLDRCQRHLRAAVRRHPSLGPRARGGHRDR